MPNFTSRAKRVVRRLAGAPDPAAPIMVHPFETYNPDAEPVVDKVTPARFISSEELNARSARLSDAQLEGVRALAKVSSPAPLPSTKFGAINGVTGWRGADL